jgi:hypothetical protein
VKKTSKVKVKKQWTYLSGGMEYADGEGIGWRTRMELWIHENLHHKIFNPNKESERYLLKVLRGKDFREMKITNIEIYTKIARRFVDVDTKEVAGRSDYIICFWDESAQKGAGTKGELTIARYFKKPVYLVTSIEKKHIPGWVLGCVTKFFETFEDLQVFLLAHYAPKGKKK